VAGYPTADLEDAVLAVSRAYGLVGAQVSATPTRVEISVGPLRNQRTYTLRVRPTAVDLDAVARLDDLVRRVLEDGLAARVALARLADIEARPLRRRGAIRLAAYAVAGAAVAPVLGGGWEDVVAAGTVGFLVGVIALAGSRRARTEPMVAPVAAVTASLAAAALAQLGLRIFPDIVTLAALITFLPGMSLTIGMRELATQHLQSGVANIASAVVQLLGLVFGVGVGHSVASNWFGFTRQGLPHAGFAGPHVVAALAAGLAFTVTLRASTGAAPIMCAATVLAILASAAGRALFGGPGGAFAAALAIGLVGAFLGTRLRRSPLLFVVPGVLMLVPGSAGFHSLLGLLTGQTLGGLNAGFGTFVTALSIAYGLLLSAALLPGRSTT
jgi:uncharacterized membrane protein YjjP (DUF1212 family)